MMSDSVTFGDRLRDLRKRAGKTQQELAGDLVGRFSEAGLKVSQTTISAWEQRAFAPAEEKLRVLAEYFYVPVTYFVVPRRSRAERMERARQYIEGIRTASFYHVEQAQESEQ